MRSPFPRQPLTGTLDASGSLTIKNQLASVQGYWSLVYIAAQVSAGTPAWSVLLGAATAAPLVYGNGQQVILGPFLLLPGESCSIVLSAGTAGSQLLGQAMGWQSDTDPSELLGLTPFTTSLFFPPSLVASVAVTNIPSVLIGSQPIGEQLIGGSGALLGDTTTPTLVADSVTITSSPDPAGATTLPIVLASFKPAGAPAIVLVKLGAALRGTNVAVNPLFGQATTAGNFLLAWVESDTATPTTTAAGWAQVVEIQAAGGLTAALWSKPNCGATEAAPQFTAVGGLGPMTAQLGEFSGVATVAPTDRTASNASNSSGPLTLTAGAVDAGVGDLVAVSTHWGYSSGTTAIFSGLVNNGATLVHAGDDGAFILNHHVSHDFAIIPAAKVSAALGIASFAMPSWPGKYDGQGFLSPASGTKATITLAANATKRWVCDHAIPSYRSVTSILVDEKDVNLIDGASGGALILWNTMLAIPSTTAAITAPYNGHISAGRFANAAINTAMTFEFSAAPIANAAQKVAIGAYLQ